MGAEQFRDEEGPSWRAVDDGFEETAPPGWGEVEPVEEGDSIEESPDDV